MTRIRQSIALLARALAISAVLAGGASAAVPATGCSTAVAPARTLAFRSAFVPMSEPPFGIAVTSDGRGSLVDETGGHVAVVSNARFRPRVVRTIGLPNDALGNSLTPDGRYLLVADGSDGATVLNVRRAQTGAGNAVLGTLSQPGESGPRGGAIEVASSPDGHYAFVAVEYQARIAVYNLHAALAKGFRGSSYVGSIPLGQLVDGLAVSPDGRWLYATSELAAGQGPVGSLSVIRLATAERTPARSVVSTALAGCSPVRVTVSTDGRTAWVAARASDELLAFSTTELRTDPAHSQLAAIPVGEAPVGLALVNGGREIVVADSNRFDTTGACAELTVVRTAAALAHRPATIGTIPTGAFPREMALEPTRPTLLVGNYDSNQLQAVDLEHLTGRLRVTAAPLTAATDAAATPRHPRNGVIAFQSNGTGHFEIFATKPNGSAVRQLTHTSPAVKNLIPSYSPDGKRIVFGSDRDGLFGLYVARADESHARRLTAPVLSATGQFVDYNSPRFFPDGKRILFTSDRTGHNEIYIIDVDGTHQRQLTHSPSTVSNFIANISPDGKTIVVASDRTGHFELFAMTAAGRSIRQLTHTATGTSTSPQRSRRTASGSCSRAPAPATPRSSR